MAEYEPDPGRRPDLTFTIRRAPVESARDLALIEQAVRPGDLEQRAARMRERVRDPHQMVVTALVDGEYAGYGKVAYLARVIDSAPAGLYLAGVTVAKQWRRRGLAHALTQARLDWIWEHADTAWYFTNSLNLASLDLHERFGFVEVDRAASFQGIRFAGNGTGVLLRADRPE